MRDDFWTEECFLFRFQSPQAGQMLVAAPLIQRIPLKPGMVK